MDLFLVPSGTTEQDHGDVILCATALMKMVRFQNAMDADLR